MNWEFIIVWLIFVGPILLFGICLKDPDKKPGLSDSDKSFCRGIKQER